MATLDPNSSFQKYLLTTAEFHQGSLLNYLQIACIKNQISALAEEQIALPFTPENIQRNAEIIGSIGALRYLITLSETAELDSTSPTSL